MNTEAEIGIGLGAIAALGVAAYVVYEHFANPPATSGTEGTSSDIGKWMLYYYNTDLTEKNDPNACKQVLSSPEVLKAAQELAADIKDDDSNWFENLTSAFGAAIHGLFLDGLIEGKEDSGSGTASEDIEKQHLHLIKDAINREIEQCQSWYNSVQAPNLNSAYKNLLGIMEANWEAGNPAPYFTQADISQVATTYNLLPGSIQDLNGFATYFNTQLSNKGPPAPEYKNASFKQLSDSLLAMARDFDSDQSQAKLHPNSSYTPIRCYMIFIEAQKRGASDAAKLQLIQGVSALTGNLRGETTLAVGEQRALLEFEVDARNLIDNWAGLGASVSSTPYAMYTIYQAMFLPMGPTTQLSYADWGSLTKRILSYQINAAVAANSTWWKAVFGSSRDWDTDPTKINTMYWLPQSYYKNVYGVWDPTRQTP